MTNKFLDKCFLQKRYVICKLVIIHYQKIQWFVQSVYFNSVIFVISIYFDSKGALNTNPNYCIDK